jgi:hypothetical protein
MQQPHVIAPVSVHSLRWAALTRRRCRGPAFVSGDFAAYVALPATACWVIRAHPLLFLVLQHKSTRPACAPPPLLQAVGQGRHPPVPRWACVNENVCPGLGGCSCMAALAEQAWARGLPVAAWD